MRLTRRELLKASAAIAAAIGLGTRGLLEVSKAMGLESGQGFAPVVWLQGQSCSGCSVSLLNSLKFGTIDSLLTKTLDLDYHPTVMAAAGELASGAAEATRLDGGYVLVVEGSIPTGINKEYCMVWPEMTAEDAVVQFAEGAAFIVAVGTCAAFGGIPAGSPDPTGAKGVEGLNLSPAALGKIINIPGCPVHPDWLVGTVAYLLTQMALPLLDSRRRPIDDAIPFFRKTVHDTPCPFRDANPGYFTKYETSKVLERGEHNRRMPPNCLSCHRANDSDVPRPRVLSDPLNCLYASGCRGRWTYADCATRKWNAGSAAGTGVNWCIGAGSPCHGCTEADFPDGKSPFIYLGGTGSNEAASTTGGTELRTIRGATRRGK